MSSENEVETKAPAKNPFFKEVISQEAAQAEIDAWLDWRKIYPSARETYKRQIEKLVEAMQYGNLVLNENKFTQKLAFPFTNELPLDTLTYKARINGKMLEKYLKGVKADDGDGRVLAYLACLTDAPKQLLKELDPVDEGTANAIVVFFLS